MIFTLTFFFHLYLFKKILAFLRKNILPKSPLSNLFKLLLYPILKQHHIRKVFTNF